MPSADALEQTRDDTLRVEAVRIHAVGPVSFSLSAGGCVCVTGESGAGKSLLLRAIADLEPHDGQASLNGVPCSDFRADAWRRRVGFLPPESAWWEDQVGPHFANVDTGLLNAVGFEADVLQWSINRLSSGERQRLALVRLLCNSPDVLLLDEPTANLDPVNVEKVEALINRLRGGQGTAAVWVSHDPLQIGRVASRELRLTGGRMTGVSGP